MEEQMPVPPSEQVAERSEEETNEQQDRALTFPNTDAMFRRFVEAQEDVAIFVMDPEGRITTWASGAERLLGYTAAEAIGKRFPLIFIPEDRETGQPEKELHVAGTEGRFYEEGWHRRKDASRFWASGILSAFKDETGRLRGFCKIVRDLTEPRQHQELLAAVAEKDRRIAETLQRAMLIPLRVDQFPAMSVATLHEAAWEEAQVGGDFYDGFLLGDKLLALIVGDASGKGLLAAVRTTQVKDVLRAFLRTSEDADAARTMARLNNYMCSSRVLDSDAEEGFVCLSLAILNTETGEATFVVAGAEPPFVLRAANGTAESVEAPGLPLGIFPAQNYPTTTLWLEPGDAILLVTDGLTEARRGVSGVRGVCGNCQKSDGPWRFGPGGSAGNDGRRQSLRGR